VPTDRSTLTLSETIESAIEGSIAALCDRLRVERCDTPTHSVVIVSGWDARVDAKRFIAQYLVGLRLSAIDCALNIRASLLDDSPEGRIDIYRSVAEVVGESNDALTNFQRTQERNPWLAEAIWHLCQC
jgi:hypothetical protein